MPCHGQLGVHEKKIPFLFFFAPLVSRDVICVAIHVSDDGIRITAGRLAWRLHLLFAALLTGIPDGRSVNSS